MDVNLLNLVFKEAALMWRLCIKELAWDILIYTQDMKETWTLHIWITP